MFNGLGYLLITCGNVLNGDETDCSNEVKCGRKQGTEIGVRVDASNAGALALSAQLALNAVPFTLCLGYWKTPLCSCRDLNTKTLGEFLVIDSPTMTCLPGSVELSKI
mmetsp:Transcript_15179/g.37231  ORF Transcript_15179/g.37231 Transcript_15179/m.37231 type:complete len:108 (+) Transcript_15179:2134-2457(+)